MSGRPPFNFATNWCVCDAASEGAARREGFQNVGSCCGAVVFVDQSAESVAALDLPAA
jgi:hypothetical protein